MAILTSHEIRKRVESGEIAIDPYVESRVQQNSLDVTLGKEVVVYSNVTSMGEHDPYWYRKFEDDGTSFRVSRLLKSNKNELLDTRAENPSIRLAMDESGWLIKPGILYLMHVEEVLCAPNLVMTLDGRSSFARLGITVHLTAGHAETGFHGQYTLEVTALHPVRVYPGMAIAQVIFQTVEGKVEDYKERGNYVGTRAIGAQPSRAWKQFK